VSERGREEREEREVMFWFLILGLGVGIAWEFGYLEYSFIEDLFRQMTGMKSLILTDSKQVIPYYARTSYNLVYFFLHYNND